MPSDTGLFGGVVVAIAVGLIALVYGMRMSAGQSWNTPSIVGGLIIVAAIAVMSLRIMNIDSPE